MKKAKAFTLLEILIVLVVIASMATIITPWVRKGKPLEEIPVVLEEFNNIIGFTRQEAISNQKNYRVVFKSNSKEGDFLQIEVEEDDLDKPGKKVYKKIDPDFVDTKYVLPESIKMQAFYKGKVNEFEENKGQGYCFVVPNGLVEPVFVHLIKITESAEEKVTFKMEPFKGEFYLINGHVRPER